MAAPARRIESVSTAELYDRWAETTFSSPLLTLGLQAAPSQLSPSSTPQPLTITELGCGAGRNTYKLLLPPFTPSSQIPHYPQIPISTINALDLSPAMLSLAQERCSSILSSPSSSPTTPIPSLPPPPHLKFHTFNALSPSLDPAILPLFGSADVVLSTL
ncbi:hypothetical protein IFR04_013514 [Cadophora malorum]|uniref:Methyltransferase domain-containing protein n=1 Tax=Cadophora malorum TaxID=108018 RepID=A0A8H7T6S9_9HELO|nr:hypothetical protein IFR04_013514 [Cadophora malorum]